MHTRLANPPCSIILFLLSKCLVSIITVSSQKGCGSISINSRIKVLNILVFAYITNQAITIMLAMAGRQDQFSSNYIIVFLGLFLHIIAEHLSASVVKSRPQFVYIYICGFVTLRNAIIKRMTTGMLIRRPRVLLMAYCSTVETSEEPTSEGATARLRRLATLRKRRKVRELQKRPRQRRN